MQMRLKKRLTVQLKAIWTTKVYYQVELSLASLMNMDALSICTGTELKTG